MYVYELMTRNVACVRVSDSLSAAARLMWDCDCGMVPVRNDRDRVVAVLTDRDICMATWSRDQAPSSISVSEVMSRQVHCCAPEDSLGLAEALMRAKQVRRLPVLDDEGALVGILSLADIARQEDRAGPRASANPGEVAATLANICQPPHAARPADPEADGYARRGA